MKQFHCTLAVQLVVLMDKHQHDWDLYFPLVLWAYRMAVQESFGCTPATLMFPRELRTPVKLVFGSPPELELLATPGRLHLCQLWDCILIVHELASDYQGAVTARQNMVCDVR